MVLLLLLILALLLWLIQGELDAAGREIPLTGNHCPNCQRATDIDWMVCPHCQHRLRESCPCCHKGKLVSHFHCPFCGEGRKERAA